MQFNIKKSQTYDKNSFKVDLFSLLVWFPAELETCAEELCHVLHNVHVVIKMMMAFENFTCNLQKSGSGFYPVVIS